MSPADREFMWEHARRYAASTHQWESAEDYADWYCEQFGYCSDLGELPSHPYVFTTWEEAR